VSECKMCEGWKLKEKPDPFFCSYLNTCNPDCPYLHEIGECKGYCKFLKDKLPWWDFHIAMCTYDHLEEVFE